MVCSAIAFGFIPVYSCSPNFSEAEPLPSCNDNVTQTPCCSRADNMGWRYLLFTLGAITLSIFILRFFIFKFRETPKYLIYRGRDDEALQTLQHMAKTNGKQCGLTVEMFESLESEQSSLDSSSSASPALGGTSRHVEWREKTKSELSRYKMLFDGFQMTRLTILTWLTYIMDFWGFTVAGKLPCPIFNTTNPDRLLPATHLGSQEWFRVCQSIFNLCGVHIHVCSRNRRCTFRCHDVSYSCLWAKMDHGIVCRLDGHIDPPLLYCGYEG